MWGFTPEEVQAFVAASNQQTGVTTPVVFIKERFRCDSCKRFMSSLETMINQSGLYCHSTEKCLTKFAKKHNWESLDMGKKQQLINTGEI